MSDINPLMMFQQSPAQAPQGTIGFQNPLQAIVMGNQLGTTLANNDMVRRNNALAVEQMKIKQGMMQQQQAEAQNNQRRIIELARKVAQGPYAERAADMAELSQLADPKNFEQMSNSFKQMSLEQQHTTLKDAGTVISLLYSGDPKHAIDYLNKRLQAARDGGDDDAVRAYMGALQVITNSKDPKQAAMQLEYAITPFDGSKDMIESIHSTLKLPGETENKQADTELKKAQAYEQYTQGNLNNRLPAGKESSSGSAGNVTAALADADSNLSQLNGVLNNFESYGKKKGLFGTGQQLQSGFMGAPAWLEDTFNASSEGAQLRAQMKNALLTPMLEKLKALRPASDVDVKTIMDALGDPNVKPLTAINAIAKQKQLLEFYRDSLKAQASYDSNKKPGESLQQYLDRVVPKPTFNENVYGSGNKGYTKDGVSLIDQSSPSLTQRQYPPNIRPSGVARQ